MSTHDLDNIPGQPVPWWMKALIIIDVLPVLPVIFRILGAVPEGTPQTLVYLYPVYVVVAAVCAWMCCSKRPEVTYIILVLMALTHAAMLMLPQLETYGY